MTLPDRDVEIVSRKTDMDFIILIGQILDEFVKMNIHLSNINNRLSEIEADLDDMVNRG